MNWQHWTKFMPILLLARGDQESRDYLRKALEARYGVGAPAIDTLLLDFAGRARTRVGPTALWFPVKLRASFSFPLSMRWDYIVKVAGMPARRTTESINNKGYHRKRGAEVDVVADLDHLRSLQCRMWCMSAMLLTPLVEPSIELKTLGSRRFEAANNQIDCAAAVQLHEDYTIDTITTTCLNPDTGTAQQYKLRMHEGQQLIGDLMLPHSIEISWDDEPIWDLTTEAAQINPTFSEKLFTLES